MSSPEAPIKPHIGDKIPAYPPKPETVVVTPTIIAPGKKSGDVPIRS